ncbi:hypothetical protein FOA43_000053 [Brettanomyces nanus]|uniref:CoA-binding domain-containing protein n=1 Tax=Eeniella nana TaxID=13502 RepID=A0A875RXX7_EENNA|nr:uncharacterized protein FOA43_000053 [Brettanomyces nanus]QPG72752.1 hypothetical protein FOA43_000053 [Brettanomyces nanus]
MSAIKQFFSDKTHYFVVGASTQPEKYGNKVLKWYIDHELPVTPVNPNAETKIYGLPVLESLAEALKRHFDKDHPKISVSFVTPPKVSLREIQMVADISALTEIQSLWFQPGSCDDDVINFCECFGFSKEKGNLIDGECILVEGEEGLMK